MFVASNLRLRESVGIVTHDNQIEFFKSNIREGLSLKMNFPEIKTLLKKFNGKNTLEQIAQEYENIDLQQLIELATYLKQKYILIEQNYPYPIDLFKKHRRLINLLEDYFHSTQEVLNAIHQLKNSTVMIIGLGAVGSFIATYLTKLGVENFIFVDNDKVDLSNLHRQYYFENQVGLNKAEQLTNELKNISPNIQSKIINKFLKEDFFETTDLPNIDLIINCSDEPNVDTTSRIIAKYAMKHKIAHIVGGGYNLHLTLIGQTIIPFQTACFECFKTALTQLNDSSLKNVRVLHREGRKLGSFSPLSNIAASLASLDAFKVLIKKYDTLQQTNRRIEFNSKTFNFEIMNINRNPNCLCCGVTNE